LILNNNSPAPTDKNYTIIKMGYGKTLYFSKTNATNLDSIYTDIKLSEDLPCLNSAQKNTRAKSIYDSKYILQVDYSDFPCTNFIENEKFDDRYEKLDSLNYNELISDNRIINIINMYPDVPRTSYDFPVEIYSRKYLGWSSYCLNDRKFGIDYIKDLSNSIKSFSTRILIQIVFIIISIIIFIGLISYLYLKSYDRKIWYVALSIIALDLFLISFAFSNYLTANSLYSENIELISLNCGDKYTELFMKFLSGNLSSLPGMFIGNLLIFVLIIILLIIPLIYVIFENKNNKEDINVELNDLSEPLIKSQGE